MSSTTATLVMGDAIAVALMKQRDFKDENFALFHPGGSLGRRLLTKVYDVMKKDDLPIINKQTSIKDIIHTITNGKCGLAIIVNDKLVVEGIITDGDIRRVMEINQEQFFDLTASSIMSKNPKLIDENSKLIEASDIMGQNKISSLIVINQDKKLSGVVQMYDLGL